MNPLRQLVRPDPNGQENLTVARYLGVWLAGKHGLRPSTHASYSTHIRLYLVPHLGSLVLTELRPEHIERMYEQIEAANGERARQVSTATRRRIHATLNSAMNTAVRRGLIARNPAATVEHPVSLKNRVEVWTASELGRFLALIARDQFHLIYVLLGLLGLRRGEVVALRWGDLDLDSGFLRVEQSVVRLGDRSVIGPPKSASGVSGRGAGPVDRPTASTSPGSDRESDPLRPRVHRRPGAATRSDLRVEALRPPGG